MEGFHEPSRTRKQGPHARYRRCYDVLVAKYKYSYGAMIETCIHLLSPWDASP